MFRKSRNYKRQFKKLQSTNDVIEVLQALAAETMLYKKQQPERAKYWQEKFDSITYDANSMMKESARLANKIKGKETGIKNKKKKK